MRAALSHNEAVALLHAWADALARAEGIRALSIKGISATSSGLRTARPSSDADILIEPGRFAAYCAALTSLGWTKYVDTVAGPALNNDRVGETFKHPAWPLTIDVHGSFPGLLTDTTTAFDALWWRRTTTAIAGVAVTTCDLLGHAVILLSHAARTPGQSTQQQEAAEVERTLAERLDPIQREQLTRLAEATGTVDTLANTWRRLEIQPTTHTDPAILREWRERVALSETHEALWIAELRGARPREWPRVLGRALWLNDEELVTYHGAMPTRSGLLRARLTRLWAGLRGLPHALRVHGRAKRSATGDQ